LRKHPNTTVFVDQDSSSLLAAEMRRELQTLGKVTVGP